MIVGLGKTGMSYARFIASQGECFVVAEDSPIEPNVHELRKINSNAVIENISPELLSRADTIFVSPGVPLNHTALLMASAKGINLKGDIQLFGELAKAPIIGITGTNGKSTVSSLVFELLLDQGKKVSLAGNIGRPCLDVLDEDVDLHVLEISSYQLELATEIETEISVVLNLQPDHMDRYSSVEDYFQTKLRLYDGTKKAVINRALSADLSGLSAAASFGCDVVPGISNFGMHFDGERTWLTQGESALIAGDELQIKGSHNFQNVLAGLAIGWLLRLDMTSMLDTAKRFSGLEHRFELVDEICGVTYINDSKATNPGALLAAVKGQAQGQFKNVHLIAGGESKGLNFEGLSSELESYVKSIYLIGKDTNALQKEFSKQTVVMCGVLENAVFQAASSAREGDVVLLSPGCSSHDQFKSFVERGNSFYEIVRRLKK